MHAHPSVCEREGSVYYYYGPFIPEESATHSLKLTEGPGRGHKSLKDRHTGRTVGAVLSENQEKRLPWIIFPGRVPACCGTGIATR